MASSPFAEQQVAQSGADAMAPAVDHVVHRDRLGAAILHADLQVVLQVGADARHVGDHVDAERLQQRGRSEPGQLQELRRVERAAGEDDLAAGVRDARRIAVPVFDADRAPSCEQDAARQRVGHDGEIGPAARLAQIADRGRAAAPVARRQLEIAGAFLGRPVEIVVARKARLLRRLDESLAQRMRLAARRRPRAARPPRAAHPRRAPGPRRGGNTAARRRSSSRHCRAGANDRNPPAGRGCRAGR